MPEPLNVWDYERLAQERLDAGAFGYFAGGSGDEVTLGENVEAFRRLKLRPRVLVDVTKVTTQTELLGHRLSLPILVAPMAYQRLAHPDGEVAVASAAARAGTIYCLSTLATAAIGEVAAATAGERLWYQLYVFSDRSVTRELLAEAIEAGASAILLTVDLPRSGRRERDLRSNVQIPPGVVSIERARRSGTELSPHEAVSLLAQDLTWRDIEWVAGDTRLPVLVKGILTAEDAILAVEHGAAGVVVSNHGGRQLDGVPAAIDALPEVVEAVGGRAPVLVDGGVRRGTDVVKALALGAEAVLAGRAVLWGLAVDGAAGAARVLELLRDEVELALALLGCASPREVTRAHVKIP